MIAAVLFVMLGASPEGNPRVPVLASSSAYKRAPEMVVLFRRYDAFFPMYCVTGGKLRTGDACLPLMPRRPKVRLMNGSRVELGPLASHEVSAWDAPARKGWSAPVLDGGDGSSETELAVWPADANPGFEPAPSGTPPLELEGVRGLPESEAPPFVRGDASWPPVVTQTVLLGRAGVAVSLSGVRRGLFLQTPGGKWRVVRAERAAEVGTTILGSTDLDGDGRPEWLVHVLGWNEFGLEVRTADFGKPLFVFNDCGV